jgi:ATP-dependent RNA helicase RhlE
VKFSQYNFLPAIQKSLEALGFNRPTDIQFKAIPNIAKGEDVMAVAATGTGKTAAYAIPIIQKLATSNRRYKGIRALVLAPTRELAVQIHGVFESIGKETDLLMVALVGGVEQEGQIRQLGEEADVVVATPGRIFDLMAQGHLNLDGVETLVLDESDRMMALGFMKDVQDIKKRLPFRHQTLFFSATINEAIKKQAYSLVHNAIRIQVSPKNSVSKNVEHTVAMIGMDDKRFFLEDIIRKHPEDRMVVFVRTQVRAERVEKAMQRVGIEVATLHGGMEQQDRFTALESFSSGKKNVLVTTDVSARGIDIKNVVYVINYDMPDLPENYIHRLGRTGRGMLKGFAMSFCSVEEKPLLKEIEQYLGDVIHITPIEKDDYKATIDLGGETGADKKKIMALIRENETKGKSIKAGKKKK